MAKQMRVTATMVVVTDKAGTVRYLNRGAPVPEDIPADNVAHLRKLGMVEPMPTVPAPRTGGGTDSGGRPNKSAKAAEWTAYALAQGVDEAVVAAATREQLVAHFHDGEELPEPTPTGKPADGDSVGSGSGGDSQTPPSE